MHIRWIMVSSRTPWIRGIYLQVLAMQPLLVPMEPAAARQAIAGIRKTIAGTDVSITVSLNLSVALRLDRY